ncbi:hypothetical protein GC175_15315 [bacterium]|nr:hypothetical protein [bacterium]
MRQHDFGELGTIFVIQLRITHYDSGEGGEGIDVPPVVFLHFAFAFFSLLALSFHTPDNRNASPSIQHREK